MGQFGGWFNVKPIWQDGLVLNYRGGNGLMLNLLPRVV